VYNVHVHVGPTILRWRGSQFFQSRNFDRDEAKMSVTRMRKKNKPRVFTRGQFHQHFMQACFVWKCFAQIFSSCSLALWLFGKRISAKKASEICWYNGPKLSTKSFLLFYFLSFYREFQRLWMNLLKVTRWFFSCHFWPLFVAAWLNLGKSN
jgi:hypothetical protein